LLFEQLRDLRRRLADERDVPAYVIFSDVTLREMARNYPTTPTEFRRIPGVGEQKVKDFGQRFLHAIGDYVAKNPRQTFQSSKSAFTGRRTLLNESESDTLRRFQNGATMDEIAQARGLVRGTIATAQEKEIGAAYAAIGPRNLTGLRDSLGGKYSIDELRIFRAFTQVRSHGQEHGRIPTR
jgi:ATP-dependent DNA helicase RecQ